MTNPLSPVMDWYEIVRDGMRVTARVIRKEIPKAITDKHVFHYEPAPASLQRLSDANQELDDLVVLSLVATFERAMRDYIMEKPGRMIVSDDPVDNAIHEAILNDIEYWRIADRLIEVFKTQIQPMHMGLIKQIVGYRNWVAHGRATAIPPDGNVAPQFAFEQLTGFLERAGIIDTS
jgi:hypothetical protein